jgi:hypothetical protein
MTRFTPTAFRRLVLAGALGLAVLVSTAWETEGSSASAATLVLAQDSKEAARDAADAAREAAREAADAAREAARDAAREARNPHKRGITIGMDVDRQYDSFDQFLDRDPGLAALVLGVVFIVFLTPISSSR